MKTCLLFQSNFNALFRYYFDSFLIQASRRNLRRALLLLECSTLSSGGGKTGSDVELMDWERFIQVIVQNILEEQSPQSLLAIRGKYYELLARLIPASVILKELAKQLVSRCRSAPLQMDILCWASTYEQKMRQGGKEIVFLEAFTARFMALYKQSLLKRWSVCSNKGISQ